MSDMNMDVRRGSFLEMGAVNPEMGVSAKDISPKEKQVQEVVQQREPLTKDHVESSPPSLLKRAFTDFKHEVAVAVKSYGVRRMTRAQVSKINELYIGTFSSKVKDIATGTSFGASVAGMGDAAKAASKGVSVEKAAHLLRTAQHLEERRETLITETRQKIIELKEGVEAGTLPRGESERAMAKLQGAIDKMNGVRSRDWDRTMDRLNTVMKNASSVAEGERPKDIRETPKGKKWAVEEGAIKQELGKAKEHMAKGDLSTGLLYLSVAREHIRELTETIAKDGGKLAPEAREKLLVPLQKELGELCPTQTAGVAGKTSAGAQALTGPFQLSKGEQRLVSHIQSAWSPASMKECLKEAGGHSGMGKLRDKLLARALATDPNNKRLFMERLALLGSVNAAIEKLPIEDQEAIGKLYTGKQGAARELGPTHEKYQEIAEAAHYLELIKKIPAKGKDLDPAHIDRLQNQISTKLGSFMTKASSQLKENAKLEEDKKFLSNDQASMMLYMVSTIQPSIKQYTARTGMSIALGQTVREEAPVGETAPNRIKRLAKHFDSGDISDKIRVLDAIVELRINGSKADNEALIKDKYLQTINDELIVGDPKVWSQRAIEKSSGRLTATDFQDYGEVYVKALELLAKEALTTKDIRKAVNVSNTLNNFDKGGFSYGSSSFKKSQLFSDLKDLLSEARDRPKGPEEALKPLSPQDSHAMVARAFTSGGRLSEEEIKQHGNEYLRSLESVGREALEKGDRSKAVEVIGACQSLVQSHELEGAKAFIESDMFTRLSALIAPTQAKLPPTVEGLASLGISPPPPPPESELTPPASSTQPFTPPPRPSIQGG